MNVKVVKRHSVQKTHSVWITFSPLRNLNQFASPHNTDTSTYTALQEAKVDLFLSRPFLYMANPSGHAFYGVGLRALTSWDCGVRIPPGGHGYLYLLSVVCCQVERERERQRERELKTESCWVYLKPFVECVSDKSLTGKMAMMRDYFDGMQKCDMRYSTV